jgi:hypothetical protein
MAKTNAPVEAKVKAASATALVAGVVVWLLGRYVFGGIVPADIVLGVEAVIPAVLAAYAGWKAKHTLRLPTAANRTSERTPGL